VEIARGTLNSLRNQAALWSHAGLELTPQIEAQIRAASTPFIEAALKQHDGAATEAAAEAIRQSLRGTSHLADAYIRQLLAMKAEQPKPPLMFAARIDDAAAAAGAQSQLTSACNMAAVSLNWAKVEAESGQLDWDAADQLVDWPRQQGLKVMAGPLVSFDSAWLPDWLVLWEEEFQELQSYVADWVTKAVLRYRGKVQLWHCAAKINSGRVLSLTDEQRLKLAVVALEVIRRHDPRTPVIISFDQPWAEYMAQSASDVGPRHFADALARANLGLSGLGLEIDWGYQPGGTLPRDLLELSRLLDAWSQLGMPLVILLTAPSSLAADAHARAKVSPLAGGVSHLPLPRGEGRAEGLWNEAQHARLVDRLVSMCLCKQSVQGIVWNQTFDAIPHALPHAGLFDARARAKPALAALREIRQKHAP
jgi:hypothetical protein